MPYIISLSCFFMCVAWVGLNPVARKDYGDWNKATLYIRQNLSESAHILVDHNCAKTAIRRPAMFLCWQWMHIYSGSRKMEKRQRLLFQILKVPYPQKFGEIQAAHEKLRSSLSNAGPETLMTLKKHLLVDHIIIQERLNKANQDQLLGKFGRFYLYKL